MIEEHKQDLESFGKRLLFDVANIVTTIHLNLFIVITIIMATGYLFSPGPLKQIFLFGGLIWLNAYLILFILLIINLKSNRGFLK